MTEQEYEQQRRECFVKFCKDNGIDQEVNISIFDAFDQIFDRAYALGKQKETITQEEIEKVAKEYVLTRQQARHNAKREEDATLRDFDKTIKAWDAFDMEQAYEDGANFALGKQEKDAESKSMCLPDKEEKMTEKRYQYLNSLSLEDYDNETSADEQRQFCEYQHKHHPDEVIYLQTYSDEKPKPAEPKFKVGDRAIYCIPEKQRIKARVVNVRQRSGSTLFNTLFNYDILLDDGRTANWVDEQWLLPDNDDQVRAVTEKASERLDKILAKDLRKEKRLRIATQLMAAMMSNPVMFNKSIEYEDIVHGSLEYADALIAEAEKGGGNA